MKCQAAAPLSNLSIPASSWPNISWDRVCCWCCRWRLSDHEPCATRVFTLESTQPRPLSSLTQILILDPPRGLMLITPWPVKYYTVICIKLYTNSLVLAVSHWNPVSTKKGIDLFCSQVYNYLQEPWLIWYFLNI